ncbi:MAG: glycoside hydrolase family 127 protein [Bacteroidales bacterium]|nr:glycoside hydrolase family 127 protein [Bacteroidales bacterium]
MKLTTLLLTLVFTLPGIAAEPVRQSFEPQDVTLLPSRFRDNFQRDSAWIMSIPAESLLHSFRTSAGVFSGNEGGYFVTRKLGGWESLDCELRGHTTGHLLSALATLEAATGSPAVRVKADSLIAGLAAVQEAYGTGYLSAYPEGLIDRNIRGERVWAPFYTLHKILQGLLDQHRLCGREDALRIARGMGDWAADKLLGLSDDTRRRMIRNEFGGYNDAMYQLYGQTGDARHLAVARFFYHDEKVDPLKAGNPDLGTNHANTFIPKVTAEARNYLQTGAEDSRRAAEFLFYTLVRAHAFATGEVSDKEHLFDPATESRHLTGYDGENCCTFNLLKLGELIQTWAPSEELVTYYEGALYNHILGQQDPETGMVCYFTPLQSGTYRLYSTRDRSFWCCVGSGFESHVRYSSFIWHYGEGELWNNLFIPSRLDWDGTVVSLETDFPASGKVTYRVDGKPRRFTLHLRKPSWAVSMTIRVNGRRTRMTDLDRAWKPGDRVEVEYGMALHEVPTCDDPDRFAVLYGPVVLAGLMDPVDAPFSDPAKYNDYYTFDYHVPATVDDGLGGAASLLQEGPLRFRTPSGLPVAPLYEAHRVRYAVYWRR